MKKILFLASAFLATLAVKAQPGTDKPAPKAEDVIKMNVETHDFGKVPQGTPVTYEFEITNISKSPVVVENTWASCGCTTPEKITEPIPAGKTVKLKVQYNAAAVAPISKDVFIKIAGIETPKSIHISGEVLSADAYTAYLKEKGEVPAPAVAPVKTTTTPGKNAPTISPVKN
jgi:hypothetical protein